MTMFVVSAPIGAPARAARTAFLPRLCRWRAPHSHARLPSHTRLPCHASLPSPQGPGPSDESLGLESPPSLLPPPQPRLDDNVDTSLDAPTPGIASNSEPLNPSVLFGEFLSTFLLVFLSLKLNNAAPSGGPFPDAAVITALAASFIPVSGAHFNPAVTIALMVTNRVPVSRALAFVVAQLAASCTAAFGALAFGVQLAPPTITATTKLALARAAASEFTPMFFIVSVVYLTAVATPREGGVGVQLAPFYIGLAVFICINAFPGATFNPARAFGPALLGNATPFHWVLWIPPILGAITAATMCEHVFLAPSVKRPPNSWLMWIVRKCSHMTDRVKTFGVAGLVSYGILNTLYYAGTFTAMMIRIGWSAGAGGLAQAWLVTWSLSQVTKPLRLGLSILLAPFVDKWLATFKRQNKKQNP